MRNIVKAVLVVFGALAVFTAGVLARPSIPWIKPDKPAVVAVDKASACLPAKSEYKEGRKEAENYMRSSARLKCYDKVWPGQKLAAALMGGRLGPTDKYDTMKKPLKPNYTGWGGIQTKDGKYSVRLYWQKGKADSKKVTDVVVDGIAIQQGNKKQDPYASIRTDAGKIYFVSLQAFGDVSMAKYVNPGNVDELIGLDAKAIDLLVLSLQAAHL